MNTLKMLWAWLHLPGCCRTHLLALALAMPHKVEAQLTPQP
jgi:hypothetical protein